MVSASAYSISFIFLKILTLLDYFSAHQGVLAPNLKTTSQLIR